MSVITIGSTLVDIFVYSAGFKIQHMGNGVQLCEEYGEKLEVDRLVVSTGGGAGNVAVGLKRLGFEVGVVSEIGTDEWGRMVEQQLVDEGVSVEWLVREKKEETGGSIALVGQDGGRTVLVHRGAAAQLDVSDIPVEALAAADWVHLSSTAGRRDAIRKIFSSVQSSKLSWNPGQAELRLLIDGELLVSEVSCQILFVNEEEWEVLRPLQAEFLAKIPMIVVTSGRSGGTVYRAGSPAMPYTSKAITTVEETGAGDAFATGFIAATLRGLSVEQAIEWASHNAASVVSQVGAKAGLLRADQLQ
jgi:ribokinase